MRMILCESLACMGHGDAGKQQPHQAVPGLRLCWGVAAKRGVTSSDCPRCTKTVSVFSPIVVRVTRKLANGGAEGDRACDGWATNTQLNQTSEWTPSSGNSAVNRDFNSGQLGTSP